MSWLQNAILYLIVSTTTYLSKEKIQPAQGILRFWLTKACEMQRCERNLLVLLRYRLQPRAGVTMQVFLSVPRCSLPMGMLHQFPRVHCVQSCSKTIAQGVWFTFT